MRRIEDEGDFLIPSYTPVALQAGAPFSVSRSRAALNSLAACEQDLRAFHLSILLLNVVDEPIPTIIVDEVDAMLEAWFEAHADHEVRIASMLDALVFSTAPSDFVGRWIDQFWHQFIDNPNHLRPGGLFVEWVVVHIGNGGLPRKGWFHTLQRIVDNVDFNEETRSLAQMVIDRWGDTPYA